MIRKKIVFILGAGAHCPYGFPSGKKLKIEVISAIENSLMYGRPDTSLPQLAMLDATIADHVKEEKCRDFATALQHAGQPSIDAFLHANRHKQFEVIGKASIAQVLLEYDSARRGGDIDVNDDWLTYLFEKMVADVWSPKEFMERNSVSFITFNYDTFLERWFFKKIKHSFGLDDRETQEVLKAIPILHVYGSLGDPFDKLLHNQAMWKKSYKGISTIYDAEIHEREEIKKIQSLWASSEVICMLGCGFHPENLEVIKLPEFLKNNPRTLIVSRFGFNDPELEVALRIFTREVHRPPAGDSIKCLETLRCFANIIF